MSSLIAPHSLQTWSWSHPRAVRRPAGHCAEGCRDHIGVVRPDPHGVHLWSVRLSAISASSHTLLFGFVRAEDGELYLFGFGECFYPEEASPRDYSAFQRSPLCLDCFELQGQNFQYTPCKIPLKEKIVQVASGQSHILALTGEFGCPLRLQID